MKKLSSVFYSILLSFILFGSNVLAAETGPRGQLQPFNIESFKDASVCKYTYERHDKLSAGLSPLFGNVKNIYVFIGDVRSRDIRNLPSFNKEDIGTIAGCTLNGLISNQQINTPVYIERKDNARPQGFLKAGNLVIDIGVSVQKELSNSTKIVLVEVGYFRTDIDDYDSIKLDRHCTKSFVYRENNQEMQKLLADSLHSCLGKVYFNKAM